MKYIFWFFLPIITINLQAQNVGIGTQSPNYPLTVQGLSEGKSITVVNGQLEIGFYNSGSLAFLQTWTKHDLHFATGNGPAKITLQNATGYVGINNPSPTAQLDVIGTVRLGVSGAAAGRALVSNAVGFATWSESVAFAAQGGFQDNFVNGGTNNILYNTELFDNGGNYNPNTAKFKAPAAGIYHFDASMRLTTGVAPKNSRYMLCVNGVAQRQADLDFGFVQLSTNVNLNLGDEVDIRYYYNDNTGATVNMSSGTLLNNFSGFLIR
jgi:hypothetical protein